MMSFLKNDLSGAGWAEELLLLVNSTFRNTIIFDGGDIFPGELSFFQGVIFGG